VLAECLAVGLASEINADIREPVVHYRQFAAMRYTNTCLLCFTGSHCRPDWVVSCADLWQPTTVQILLLLKLNDSQTGCNWLMVVVRHCFFFNLTSALQPTSHHSFMFTLFQLHGTTRCSHQESCLITAKMPQSNGTLLWKIRYHPTHFTVILRMCGIAMLPYPLPLSAHSWEYTHMYIQPSHYCQDATKQWQHLDAAPLVIV